MLVCRNIVRWQLARVEHERQYITLLSLYQLSRTPLTFDLNRLSVHPEKGWLGICINDSMTNLYQVLDIDDLFTIYLSRTILNGL